MSLGFAKFKGSGDSYPKKSYEGQEDQSYGFLNAFKLQTGVLRGTQTIASPDGSKITNGIIPGTVNEFGTAYYDSQGNLIQKITNGTTFAYNVETGKNFMQIGVLPDGTGGIVIVKEGLDVSEAFDD